MELEHPPIPDKVKARTYFYYKDLAEIVREHNKLDDKHPLRHKAIMIQVEITNKIVEVYDKYEKEGEEGIINL